MFFTQARDRGPVGAGFHRMASANGSAQPKKPRWVRQQRRYNPHEDVPVVVSIMRYLQDVRRLITSHCKAASEEVTAPVPRVTNGSSTSGNLAYRVSSYDVRGLECGNAVGRRCRNTATSQRDARR